MVSIRYDSYCKHSEFFLYNQNHNQHVRSAYFVQFSGCVWEDYIICHMWVSHDPETSSRSFVFCFIFYVFLLYSLWWLLNVRNDAFIDFWASISVTVLGAWLEFSEHLLNECIFYTFISSCAIWVIFVVLSRLMMLPMPLPFSICSYLLFLIILKKLPFLWVS